MLVFSIYGIISSSQIMGGGQVGLLEYAITASLAVIVVVFSIGGISGAHVNPAVTIAFATAGPFPWSKELLIQLQYPKRFDLSQILSSWPNVFSSTDHWSSCRRSFVSCVMSSLQDFEWSSRAIHVSAINQTKWWLAKRFLHPDVVAVYAYIFLWDEDLGVANFHAGRVIMENWQYKKTDVISKGSESIKYDLNTVSIIIWEKNWCKTCWYFILQAFSSYRSGIVTTSLMYSMKFTCSTLIFLKKMMIKWI